ncbi:hypothetical protein F5Y02DRAFT_429063 [Annulohypoxylon stygium]|nr:hypothetical protein F5Y02DRAFT_429063 [Annulohypoxylon stygium]
MADAFGMRNGPNVLEIMNLLLYSEVRVYRENKGWTGTYKLLARNENTRTVEINERFVDFRITSVKLYFRDESMDIPNDDGDSDSDTEQDEPDEYIPDPEGTAKRGRGRLRGSKNKPKDAGHHEKRTRRFVKILDLFLMRRTDDVYTIPRNLRVPGGHKQTFFSRGYTLLALV